MARNPESGGLPPVGEVTPHVSVPSARANLSTNPSVSASSSYEAAQTASDIQAGIDIWHTWYLIPDVDGEREAADAWREAKGQHIPLEQIVVNLNLGTLSQHSKVYVLCRKPKRGVNKGRIRDAQPITGTEQGMRIHAYLEPEVIAQDFELYGPVLGSQFWQPGSNRHSSRIDVDGMSIAIGQLAIPWSPAFVDGNECKPPKKPSLMYLRAV